MTAQEHLKAGRLDEAVAAQIQWVKAHPTDADARFLLFTLLCFNGELERAEIHLEAASVSDESTRVGASLYHSLLAAEYERRKVHQEGARPVLPPDPPRSAELRLETLAAFRAGRAEAARAALEAAVEESVELHGKLNGEVFDGLRDYDDVLGNILEIYAGGRCLWMPLERIRKLEVAEPRHQLDLLWARAELEDANGEQATVYLPALYPGSHEHADTLVRLGRATEWSECLGVAYRGAGQKSLFTVAGEEERETPILAVRTLDIESPAENAIG